MPYVTHLWIHNNKLEERAYQTNIAKSAVEGNTIVVLPTGLGKTNIAALVSAYRLEKDMYKKIMFLAPTKPLVNQHRDTFERLLKIGTDELKVVTGEIKPSDRWKLYQKGDVIFSTPQTIKNDLKSGRLSLRNFSLLIVDECHRCVKNYAYTDVVKSYMGQADDPLVLALTASPGGHLYKISEVKKKLFIDRVEVRTRDSEDVKPYLQKVEQDVLKVALTPAIRDIERPLLAIKSEAIEKLVKWKLVRNNLVTKKELLMLQEKLGKTGNPIKYHGLSAIAEAIKIDHALGLLETQTLYSLTNFLNKIKLEGESGDVRASERILKSKNFLDALKLTNKLIELGEEHPKIEKLKYIVKEQISRNKESRIIIFAQYRDTLDKITKTLNEIEGVKAVEFIGQAKRSGRGMSQKEQVKIVNEFKLGFYNVLCSSSIGEEGLDIVETNLVVFYEPVPSAIRKIQRAGRTGRTMSGSVIVLITEGTRDEAYYWSAYHKERKMKNIVERMHEKTLLDFS